MKLDSKKLGILALATGGVGLLAYFLLNKENIPPIGSDGYLALLNISNVDHLGATFQVELEKNGQAATAIDASIIIDNLTPISIGAVGIDGRTQSVRLPITTGTHSIKARINVDGTKIVNTVAQTITIGSSGDQPYPGQGIIHVTPVLTDSVPKVIVNIRNWLRTPTNWVWSVSHPFAVNVKGTNSDGGTVTGAYSINYELWFPEYDPETKRNFFIEALTSDKSQGGHFYTENGYINITGEAPNWQITYLKGLSPG